MSTLPALYLDTTIKVSHRSSQCEPLVTVAHGKKYTLDSRDKSTQPWHKGVFILPRGSGCLALDTPTSWRGRFTPLMSCQFLLKPPSLFLNNVSCRWWRSLWGYRDGSVKYFDLCIVIGGSLGREWWCICHEAHYKWSLCPFRKWAHQFSNRGGSHKNRRYVYWSKFPSHLPWF